MAYNVVKCIREPQVTYLSQNSIQNFVSPENSGLLAMLYSRKLVLSKV